MIKLTDILKEIAIEKEGFGYNPYSRADHSSARLGDRALLDVEFHDRVTPSTGDEKIQDTCYDDEIKEQVIGEGKNWNDFKSTLINMMAADIDDAYEDVISEPFPQENRGRTFNIFEPTLIDLNGDSYPICMVVTHESGNGRRRGWKAIACVDMRGALKKSNRNVNGRNVVKIEDDPAYNAARNHNPDGDFGYIATIMYSMGANRTLNMRALSDGNFPGLYIQQIDPVADFPNSQLVKVQYSMEEVLNGI